LKLYINTASSFKGGGIQVAKSYIEEFKKFPENEYLVVLSSSLEKALQTSDFPTNFQFYSAPFRPATKILSPYSTNFFLKELEKKWKPDIVFSTAGPSYWRPKVKHVMGFTIPHYVYPDSPYFNQIGLKNRFQWKLRKSFAKFYFKRDADILVTQTPDVSKRVKSFLGKEKVFTISNTIHNSYKNPILSKNKLPKKTEKEFRLLTLSAWYPHKNIRIIPRVIEVLKEKGYEFIRFIVTLPEIDFTKLEINAKHKQQIINLGTVKIEEGASLYQECDSLFLPTLLECFSASYAEAMIMEKPILTSDLGFAHTVCGDAAIYFDPMNPSNIAEKIIKLYEDEALQETLMQRGKKRLEQFGTAEERAIKLLDICKQTISGE
jgi:glycosyltransferase involved in cell wall biosynthesis